MINVQILHKTKCNATFRMYFFRVINYNGVKWLIMIELKKAVSLYL